MEIPSPSPIHAVQTGRKGAGFFENGWMKNAGCLLVGAILGLSLRRRLVKGWAAARRREKAAVVRIARLERQVAERAKQAVHLSHELRNPINGILGAVHAIEAGGGGRDWLGTIRACGVSLTALAEQASETEDGEQSSDLRCEAFSPFAPLMAASRMLDAQAQKAGVVFHIVADGDVPPCVMGDEGRVRQIIVNYAYNALKFCGGGRVELEVKATKEGLCYSVADRGPGVPLDEQRHLFTRFTRVKKSGLVADVPGMGLGLAISRGLAELMGGATGMNDREGGGAVFWVRLDLATAEAPASETKDERLPVVGDRALIVEDVGYNAEVLDMMLSEMGFDCSWVCSAEAALDVMQGERFDVVFTDFDLPGMGGLEFVRQAKDRTPAGRAPFYVATTAYSDEATRLHCLAQGLDAFVAKPVSVERLRELLPVRRGAKPPKESRLEAALGNAEILDFLGGLSETGRKASRALFAETLRGGLRLMVGGLESGDREIIRRAAHQLVGYTRMLDSECLSRLAERLERSAFAADAAELAALSGELENRVQGLVSDLLAVPAGRGAG